MIARKQQSAMSAALQSEGYKVAFCETPQKARDLVFSNRPDFVILHLESLGSNDPVTVQECAALVPKIPVIVATSFPGHEALMKAFVRGNGTYVYVSDDARTILETLATLKWAERE